MELTYAELSGSLKREIDRIKPELMAFTRKFGGLQESRAELAPRFMQLYNKLAGDNAGFTFVEYARLFDSSIPTNSSLTDGYRGHRTYQAADYLRRLTRQRPRGRANVRDGATDALARMIATLLQIAPSPDPIWTAVQAEFKFGERAMTGLKRRVESTKPLITLRAQRIQVGNVIHMAQPEAVPQAPTVAQGRRRVA